MTSAWVLDAAGSERASVFGTQDGGFTSSLYAATRPQRVDRLILYTVDPGYPVDSGDDHLPWEGAWGRDLREAYLARVAEGWGTREFARWHLGPRAPSVANDPAVLDWYTAWMQLAASPSSAATLFRIYFDTNLQPTLTTIRVPTLVLHRVGDLIDPIAQSRYVVGLIPDGRLVELPGDDHQWFAGDTDAIVDEVQEFLTGVRQPRDLDRVLATVLFTDIVESTETAAGLGDARWKELLAKHDDRARAETDRHRGHYVDSTGDGLFATFDGPARAVRCAQAIGASVRDLGIQIRAGVHTGEVELEGNAVRGIAVHIGARVAALAGPAEVLVSQTVKDLVAGSGLTFGDAGEHELKGVPGLWHLYEVAREGA